MRGRAIHSTSPDFSVPQPEQLQLPQPDEWRERKLARAAAARAKGRRFGTICCRMRGYRNLVPDSASSAAGSSAPASTAGSTTRSRSGRGGLRFERCDRS